MAIGSKLFYKTINSVSQKENKLANIFQLFVFKSWSQQSWQGAMAILYLGKF